MNQFVLIIVIISLSFLGFAKQNKNQDNGRVKDIELDTAKSSKYVKSGLIAFSEKEYDHALKDFEMAIRYREDNQKAYFYLGVTCYEMNNYETAVAAFTRAIYLNKSDTTSYKLRAEAKKFANDLKGAIEDYSIAIKWDPKDILMYLGRGSSYSKLGSYKEAINDFTICINASPTNAMFFERRGYAFMGDSDYKNAISDYSIYLRLGGSDIKSYHYRGFSYIQLGSENPLYADSAITDLKVYLHSGQNKRVIYRLLGMAYAIKNDSVKSRNNFALSMKELPNEEDTPYVWGSVEINFHNYAQSLKLLNESLTLSKTPSINLYYRLGIAKAGTRDTIGALADYERAIKIDSNMVVVYAARVKLLFSRSKYNSLILNDLERLIIASADPNRIALLHSGKSLIYLRENELKSAKLEIETAIKQSSSQPFLYLVRAILKTKDHQRRNSITSDYDRAIQLSSKFHESYLMKAYFYRDLNDLSRACENLKVAEKKGSRISIGVRNYLCDGKELNGSEESALNYVIYPYIKEAIVNP